MFLQCRVANQYICPVFKWGTQEEWEFGLQRVINFPASRKQSERTYLLKCLVGCPMQAAKIERMLNLTILEENKNFTENDIFLEFNMLSSGSSGYISLFNFLSNNWDVIRERWSLFVFIWFINYYLLLKLPFIDSKTKPISGIISSVRPPASLRRKKATTWCRNCIRNARVNSVAPSISLKNRCATSKKNPSGVQRICP